VYILTEGIETGTTDCLKISVKQIRIDGTRSGDARWRHLTLTLDKQSRRHVFEGHVISSGRKQIISIQKVKFEE
jgi:hypothetical protein